MENVFEVSNLKIESFREIFWYLIYHKRASIDKHMIWLKSPFGTYFIYGGFAIKEIMCPRYQNIWEFQNFTNIENNQSCLFMSLSLVNQVFTGFTFYNL